MKSGFFRYDDNVIRRPIVVFMSESLTLKLKCLININRIIATAIIIIHTQHSIYRCSALAVASFSADNDRRLLTKHTKTNNLIIRICLSHSIFAIILSGRHLLRCAWWMFTKHQIIKMNLIKLQVWRRKKNCWNFLLRHFVERWVIIHIFDLNSIYEIGNYFGAHFFLSVRKKLSAPPDVKTFHICHWFSFIQANRQVEHLFCRNIIFREKNGNFYLPVSELPLNSHQVNEFANGNSFH